MSPVPPLCAKIAVIGGAGWLGRAMIEGLLSSRVVTPGCITVTGRGARSSPFPQWPGITYTQDNQSAAANADIVILSVRPSDLSTIQLDLTGCILVSVIAGCSLADLERIFHTDRVIRCMPNAAAECRASYTPWYARASLSDTDSDIVSRILQAFGKADRVPHEADLDFLTALSGSGPAFPALLASAMVSSAQKAGVPLPIARRAVAQTLKGAASLMRDENADPAVVVDTFMTYGGTTAAGLSTMISNGFLEAVQRGLEAAAQKARS